MKEATVFRRFLPDQALRPHVAYYWFIEFPTPRVDGSFHYTMNTFVAA